MEVGLGFGKDFTIRIEIHGHIYILQYSTEFTENVRTAEIQVAVYDLGSLNTSHHIMLIIQRTN